MTELTAKDLAQLSAKGISTETVEAQLERFKTGFPFLKLIGAASMGKGITEVDAELEKACLARWEKFVSDGGEVVKFVPASGAASRMFKALFAFVDGEDEHPEEGSPASKLLKDIESYAFYADLDAACVKLYGEGVKALLAQGREKDVVRALILPEGLAYGSLPKALLKFHRYDGDTRTALEEQLAEAEEMVHGNSKVKVHFTVSENHHKLFDEKLEQVIPALEKEKGVKYEVSLSEQKPSTDTIAVAPDNSLFRDDNGALVFRPGGHGALIENLSDIDAQVVFIKNIDNIAVRSIRSKSVPYKKLLGGMLLLAHDAAMRMLEALKNNPDEETVDMATEFVNNVLCTNTPAILPPASVEDRTKALIDILDRPYRVCGMVRNEGEPGGGPYIAYSSDGAMTAPQILESSQIDMSKSENKEMMANSTHFNPVDLACWLHRPDGSAYDLREFVDPATGFISEKSLAGRELRALELPGLWNGAMSRWNTIFIEVPGYTFTPAKTVNDLSRAEHQA